MSTAMVLSETNMQWLRELPGDVTHGDLDRAYGFEHPLNHSRRLEKQQLSTGQGDENLLWWIQLQNGKQEELLDSPLARRIYKDKPLASAKANGPVVYNALFVVKDRFKGQKLARHIYAGELLLYKKWGIREIHIEAVNEGLVVWPKSFGFLPQDPEALEEKYLSWSRKRRNPSQQVPSRIVDYPNEYLLSLGSLELFKVIS